MPGELHLFLRVLQNGWRQIKFWDIDAAKWNLGWLSPYIHSFPMWFYLFKNGMFTEKATLFDERGDFIRDKKILFYFKIKAELNVYNKSGDKLCSYPAGTIVAQDGYFHSCGKQAYMSHCYTGRGNGEFTFYHEMRHLDPMLECLVEEYKIIITKEE